MSVKKNRLHDAALRVFTEAGSRNISISALAKEARVVRGTVYNNIVDLDTLFDDVASYTMTEMSAQTRRRLDLILDPAERFSISIKTPLKMMAADPALARFIVKFVLQEQKLHNYWAGIPTASVRAGIEEKRFDLESRLLGTFMNQAAGALFMTMSPVTEGWLTWREAGEKIAYWQLLSLGLAKDDAAEIASRVLPELSSMEAA